MYVLLSFLAIIFGSLSMHVSAATQNGSVGLEGKVPGPPPSQGATISIPSNGQSFTTLPITVSGICHGDVIVKLYKNGVFSGAAQCTNGSFTIITDLFDGRNDLQARVFDALDQEGPKSNVVTVNFQANTNFIGNRVSVTSVYAKKGADPKTKLDWPFTISNGTPPYAVSIDWGDHKTSDLISRQFPGEFTASHTYDEAGIYNVIVKVTDKNGVSAFLQVVAVANGQLKQANSTASSGGSNGNTTVVSSKQILWWPALFLIPMAIITFWLGKRHQLHTIRRKLSSGDRPF